MGIGVRTGERDGAGGGVDLWITAARVAVVTETQLLRVIGLHLAEVPGRVPRRRASCLPWPAPQPPPKGAAMPDRLSDLAPWQVLDIPPVWLVGHAVAAWLLSRALPPTLGGWALVPGVALIAAGAALLFWSAWHFRRARTTIVPHLRPTALLTSGPYGLSRNPIYLADALVLAGLCLLWRCWPALLLVPLFVWVITARFIRSEEARLSATFGEAFHDWEARVRRWI